MKIKLALFAACAAILVSAPALAAQASGTCSGMTTTDFATSTSVEDTQSATFVNLNDAGLINFKVGKAGCVLVLLAASSEATSGMGLIVRVMLDNTTSCSPYNDNFGFNAGINFTSSNAFVDGAMTFVCTSVPKGFHAIQVQYLAYGDAGGGVIWGERTLTVTHS